MAGEPGGVGQQRGESLHPAVDRNVVDLDAAFGEEFLDVAVGQAVAQVPADRHDDHLGRKNGTRPNSIGAATRSHTGQHASPVKTALILRSASATEPGGAWRPVPVPQLPAPLAARRNQQSAINPRPPCEARPRWNCWPTRRRASSCWLKRWTRSCWPPLIEARCVEVLLHGHGEDVGPPAGPGPALLGAH